MLDRSTRGDPPKFWSPIDRVRAPSAANFSRAASPTILPSPGGFHRFGQLAASVKDQPSFGNHRVWQLFAGKIPGMFAQQSRSCQHRPARISLVILAGLLSFRRIRMGCSIEFFHRDRSVSQRETRPRWRFAVVHVTELEGRSWLINMDACPTFLHNGRNRRFPLDLNDH